MLTSDFFNEGKKPKRSKKARTRARKTKSGYGWYPSWPGYGLVGDGGSTGDSNGGGDGGGGESIMREEEEIFEVKMSPNRIKQWAESPEARGIRAGFEAELIFRDTQASIDNGENGEYEPDMDYDERVNSIDDALDFFQSGDGYLSTAGRARIRDQVWERYMEWIDEQAEEIFTFGEFVDRSEDDWLDTKDEWLEKAQEKYGGKNSVWDEEDIQNHARSMWRLDLKEKYDEGWDNDLYQNAYDEFREELAENADWTDFFDYADLTHYSDWWNEFELDWPHYTSIGGGESNYGSRSWEEISDSLSNAIDVDRKNVFTGGYHGVARRPGRWILEEDGSLNPDDGSEEAGIEIVSPPMLLNEAIDKLIKLVAWANDENDGNAYSNHSTGLHMGVSLPFKNGDVDFLKLVLFLGDEYILKQFNRSSNIYCRSGFLKLKKALEEKPETAKDIMFLIKKDLIQLAQKELTNFGQREKYTSTHAHEGYVEFRSVGGDWLNQENNNPEILTNTMRRYAFAMYLAGRPDLERKEYAKKLTKLISEATTEEGASLWAQFQIGAIDADELKTQWAKKVAREQPLDLETELSDQWIIADKSNPDLLFTNRAFDSKEDAEQFQQERGNERSKLRYEVIQAPIKYWEIQDENREKTLGFIRGTYPQVSEMLLDTKNDDWRWATIASLDRNNHPRVQDWEAWDPDTSKVVATFPEMSLEDAIDQFLYRNVFDLTSYSDKFPNSVIRPINSDEEEPKTKELTRRQQLARQIVQRQAEKTTPDIEPYIVAIKPFKVVPIVQDYKNKYFTTIKSFSDNDAIEKGRDTLIKSLPYIERYTRYDFISFPLREAGKYWIVGGDTQADNSSRTINVSEIFKAESFYELKEIMNEFVNEHNTSWKGNPTVVRFYDLLPTPIKNRIQRPSGQVPTEFTGVQPTQQPKAPVKTTQSSSPNNSSQSGSETVKWRIFDNNNNQIHEFWGVGNSQRDANIYAERWLLGHGRRPGEEYTVVPFMGESKSFTVKYLKNNLPKQAMIKAETLHEATERWKIIAKTNGVNKWKILGE